MNMPKRYDECVKKVSRKIKSGEIPKTYVKRGKRYESNPYAICSKLRAKGKVYKHKTGKSVKYKTITGDNFMDILDIAHENMIERFKLKNKKR